MDSIKHKSFHYKNIDELEKELDTIGISLPLSENISLLNETISAAGYKFCNRLAIQPMEGCDGTTDGRPGEFTLRRYDRFAASGAGLIWVEAVAVTPESRANPRQLMITEDNLSDYQKMVEKIKKICLAKNGFEPVIIMQATHSGRYSKPYGTVQPQIMWNNPHLEKENVLPASAILSDDDLQSLEEEYACAAKLAEKAGFDGVDVKACHRYLISESFSAYERPGLYGGSFENRTRLFRNALSAVKAVLSPKVFLTSRMNMYDGFPYPCGMGVLEKTGLEPQLDETVAIVKMLRDEFGVGIVDLTLGNPYSNPHVNQPFDTGPYDPPEHPLEGVARASFCTGQIKKAVPEMVIVSSAVTYLRQLSGNFGAGQIEEGIADIIGFGRQSFAYPDFASDLLNKGKLDEKKCCITCGKCSQLMRAGSTAGCVIRDEIYLPVYKKDVLGNEKDISKMISNDHP